MDRLRRLEVQTAADLKDIRGGYFEIFLRITTGDGIEVEALVNILKQSRNLTLQRCENNHFQDSLIRTAFRNSTKDEMCFVCLAFLSRIPRRIDASLCYVNLSTLKLSELQMNGREAMLLGKGLSKSSSPLHTAIFKNVDVQPSALRNFFTSFKGIPTIILVFSQIKAPDMFWISEIFKRINMQTCLIKGITPIQVDVKEEKCILKMILSSILCNEHLSQLIWKSKRDDKN